jgi:hydrogenase expression/formation protein HypC
MLLDEPKIGEYVLVHAGFAIKKIDEREAAETIRTLNRLVDK